MLPTWRRRQTMERHHHVQPVRICSPGTESQHRWNAASTAGPSPASSSSSLEKENAGSALPKSVECPPPPLHRRRTRIHVATEHMWYTSPLLAACPSMNEWCCGVVTTDDDSHLSFNFQLQDIQQADSLLLCNGTEFSEPMFVLFCHFLHCVLTLEGMLETLGRCWRWLSGALHWLILFQPVWWQ